METETRNCACCNKEFECIEPVSQWRCVSCQVEFRINDTPENEKIRTANRMTYADLVQRKRHERKTG